MAAMMGQSTDLRPYESKEETARYLIEDAGWFSKQQQDTIKLCLFKHKDTFALTQTGYQIMKEHFISHDLIFSGPLTIKEKIILGGKVISPYYYDGRNKVTIFDSKAAFIASLGTAEQWLRSLIL